MAPFIQLPVGPQTPTPSVNIAEIKHRETVYFSLLMALSGVLLLLCLLCLGCYFIARRRRGRSTVTETMMHSEIQNLRLSVQSLERQLDCCTCGKRLPWEDPDPFSSEPRDNGHTIRRNGPNEWVEFDIGEVNPSNSYAAASDAEQGIVGQAVSTDVRGEHTTTTNPPPPSSGRRGSKRRSSSHRELRELNRSRVRYLQSVPEIDEKDDRFAVGEESDDGGDYRPPWPENPRARSPPPPADRNPLVDPFSDPTAAIAGPMTPSRKLA